MTREGRCTCGAVRYELSASPLIVHACHCLDCQRITGSAFVVNLWIESKFVRANGAEPRSYRLKAGSGKPHDVFFCATCGTCLWSRYHVVKSDCLFVRAGTLERPGTVTPDVHIFTRTKVPWLTLPKGARAFRTYYKIEEVWPRESRERLRRNGAA
jgi:hypothetical protein